MGIVLRFNPVLWAMYATEGSQRPVLSLWQLAKHINTYLAVAGFTGWSHAQNVTVPLTHPGLNRSVSWGWVSSCRLVLFLSHQLTLGLLLDAQLARVGDFLFAYPFVDRLIAHTVPIGGGLDGASVKIQHF